MAAPADAGREAGEGGVVATLTLDRALRGETVIFPQHLASVTAIQPGRTGAEGCHIGSLVRIEAENGSLSVEMRDGDVLEAERIVAGNVGMNRVRLYLTDGSERVASARDHIESITAEVQG